ncbi:hypothetical protein GCM10010300_57960 [Streptomyces olivaceoviridis]|nr:hypothetical protein GCM10010300_57960 [Streptomyces olivaceoviridis]
MVDVAAARFSFCAEDGAPEPTTLSVTSNAGSTHAVALRFIPVPFGRTLCTEKVGARRGGGDPDSARGVACQGTVRRPVTSGRP